MNGPEELSDLLEETFSRCETAYADKNFSELKASTTTLREILIEVGHLNLDSDDHLVRRAKKCFAQCREWNVELGSRPSGEADHTLEV